MHAAPVSVIVPCYRCADSIERAVRSVAAQSRRPAELILVDDGSPDDTGAALERLRDRFGADWIRIVRLPQNVGAGSARNAGWNVATQPFVAFLDSDDAWHPRKIEIQLAWMEAHPEVAVTGHGARQLASEAEIPDDPGSGDAQFISRRVLYASNKFITPSVMLRRDIPQRFESGKRYMEDYLLWLEIAASDRKIARLPQVLAYTFKAPFGEAGLSAHPWKMEQGELAVFSSLRRNGQIGAGSWLLLSGFSLVKFLRRILMLATGYSPSGVSSKPALLYVAAYLVLTQAMTALLIFAGLFGRGELAADIGVVQAATLATFFAFSGNARNLILTDRASVQRGAILAARMALLLPLGAAAALLCAIVGRVDPALIFVLIARRAVEWIGELHLSESELMGRHAEARSSLLLQIVLLVAAAGALAIRSEYLLWVLAAWALLPVFPLVRFIGAGTAVSVASLRSAVVLLLPHLGSTAASGMSLYAFRSLLVLVAGKSIAGDLFAAFAVGSFPGSMFANVLGPSVSLHEERIGRAYMPRILWIVTTAYLLGGAALLGLHWSAPEVLAASGKSALFWTALGWSLLGGVVMMVAQRVRLRLVAGDGRGVFGADVLMHIYLIAAIPALYAVGRIEGLALLYFLNAALALFFYAGEIRGDLFPFDGRTADRITFATVFLIFFPLFFYITGKIFNPSQPMVDSGGVPSNLPLPVSLLVCSGGLLLYGRYSRATTGLWTIFGLLFLMLISTAVAGGDSGSLDRAKMLLLLQIILPTLGLVLGAVVDPNDRHRYAFQVAILMVVALVVPAQLAATWLDGSRTLRHSVFLFGVYQHIQFVPVILVCGYFIAFQGLWVRWGTPGRIVLSILLAFVAVYAVAAHSVLAMFAVTAGTALFGVTRLVRARELGAALAMAAVFGAFSGYLLVVKETYDFHHKFSFLFPPGEEWAGVTAFTAGVRPRLLGGWYIVGLPQGGYIVRFGAPESARQATLVVEGELFEGEIRLAVENKLRNTFASKLSVSQKGSFKAEIQIDQDQGEGDVLIYQPEGATRGIVRSMKWVLSEPKRQNREAGLTTISPVVAEDATPRATGNSESPPMFNAIRNVAERVSDWKLFGRGILDSPKAILFGHPKPLAREQRTSAHNFYIDFTYNFGILALLPLLALIIHTGTLLWRRRHEVLASETLFALAAAVAFLVLVESNLKVSLRQPYPGIAIFFLWGLLLARMRDPAAAKAD